MARVVHGAEVQRWRHERRRTDGRLGHTSGTLQTFVGLSNGSSGFSDFSMWRDTWCNANKVVAGDFNGDGKTDISCHTATATSVALSGGLVGRTDVLTSIQSSAGGLTTIAYVPGTECSSTEPPPPGQLSQDDSSNGSYSASTSFHRLSPGSPTVSSVTVSDGRGWSKTTTYEYGGGLYDSAERKWLGYEYSIRTEPPLPGETAGPWTRTWFLQHVAASGAVDALESRDGTGKLLSYLDNSLETDGDGETEPYTAKVRWRRTESYDGTTTARCSFPCAEGERSYQWFDYDEYGNRIETENYGNEDATGDETTTFADYFPNSSAFIVNKLARSITYAGIGAGTKLAEARFFYDGATSHTLEPVEGLLTNRESWLDVGDRYIPMCTLPSGECIQYDAYGNVTQTTDIKGGVAQLTYDTTYNLFLETVTNTLGHVTETEWDDRCQAPTSTTDPNLQVTTTTYDDLCRHDRTDGPLGSFAETSYVSIGTPTSQYTQVDTPSPTGTGTHWSRSYFDGLGRTYRSESRGATGGQDIQSGEVTFNARGAVASAAAPRFTGGAQYFTSFTYDVRNRLSVTTLPDSVDAETLVYGLREASRYDAESHRTSESRSENGVTSYLDEYLGSTPIRTTTTRNLTARTVVTTDHSGNTWTMWFDSLGRITTVSDPDSGMESREYNDAGELIAVTNMLGERTELAYDLLGRITTKTTRAGTGGAETTTFLYDEARSGYFNKGRQTSMLDSAGYQYDDYDALGRPARTQRSLDAQVYVFNHGYNSAGLPSSTTYPDSQVISWTYDAAGNLKTETGTIVDSTYDAAGRTLTRSFTNGVVTTYGYSPERGWIETIDTIKNSSVFQDLVYQHDDEGMIESISSSKAAESWTYAYDDLHRLLTATNVDTPSLTQGFTYDEIGNITYNSHIGTYTYPTPGSARPHAVSTAGARSYQYNLIGQMTSRNGTVIQWNGDQKPSSIGSVGFTYDGVGARLKKVSGGDTTRYIGGDYEIAPDGTITKYLQGGKQRGTNFFIHHRDHLGSIQVVTNQFGWQVRRQKHKPFGDQHDVWGTHPESKGWIGEREEETELVYLNARYYDPEIARFVSPDPIASLGQKLNRYAYAHNDPINFMDASGLQESSSKLCHDAVFDPDGVPVRLHSSPCDSEHGRAALVVWAPSSNSTSADAQMTGRMGLEDRLARFLENEECRPHCHSPVPEAAAGPTPATNNTPTPATTDNPCQNGINTNCPGNGANDDESLANEAASVAGAGTVVVTAGLLDGPLPVVEMVVTAGIVLGALNEQRVHVTYTLQNKSGKVYVGRASGFGTPTSVMMGRFYHHHMRLFGYGNPILDQHAYGSPGYFAVRGREQQLIDSYGGIGSPRVGNIIRGVARRNPLGLFFHTQSDLFFGPLSPYTGYDW